MDTPSAYLLGAVIALGTFAFVLAAVVGGGMATVQRQRRSLAVLGVALVAVVLILPALQEAEGPAVEIVLVAASFALFAWRRFRPEPRSVAQIRPSAY